MVVTNEVVKIKKVLKGKNYLDYPENFRVTILVNTAMKDGFHSHDFFEICLILSDDVEHYVNGAKNILNYGDLLLVRPSDEHDFNNVLPSCFINVAFSSKMALDTFDFLGESFKTDKLLSMAYPPVFKLSNKECDNLQSEIKKLNFIDYNDKSKRNLIFKKFLICTLIEYFSTVLDEVDSEVPEWLLETCRQMHVKENFYVGLPAMVELSGKSYKHLSRCVKRYYNKSVTEYINEIRINYAFNLLKQTNLNVIDIAYDCGFTSLNWFNVCFKKKFGTSPLKVRGIENK